MARFDERGGVRLRMLTALATASLIGIGAYASLGLGQTAAPSAVATVTAAKFEETQINGGPDAPAHLDITFTGTPTDGDSVRVRPENNDATGWNTADPKKDEYSFNKKDDTGPYFDVTLTGMSPMKVAVETVDPDMDRKDTIVTMQQGKADPVKSKKITISHS